LKTPAGGPHNQNTPPPSARALGVVVRQKPAHSKKKHKRPKHRGDLASRGAKEGKSLQPGMLSRREPLIASVPSGTPSQTRDQQRRDRSGCEERRPPRPSHRPRQNTASASADRRRRVGVRRQEFRHGSSRPSGPRPPTFSGNRRWSTSEHCTVSHPHAKSTPRPKSRLKPHVPAVTRHYRRGHTDVGAAHSRHRRRGGRCEAAQRFQPCGARLGHLSLKDSATNFETEIVAQRYEQRSRAKPDRSARASVSALLLDRKDICLIGCQCPGVEEALDGQGHHSPARPPPRTYSAIDPVFTTPPENLLPPHNHKKKKTKDPGKYEEYTYTVTGR